MFNILETFPVNTLEKRGEAPMELHFLIKKKLNKLPVCGRL